MGSRWESVLRGRRRRQSKDFHPAKSLPSAQYSSRPQYQALLSQAFEHARMWLTGPMIVACQ